MKIVSLLVPTVVSLIALGGCEKKPAAPAPAPPAATNSTDTHTHDEGHDHDDADGHHGSETSLGSQTAGPFQINVTLAGEIAAGKEVALRVTSVTKGTAKPDAVRAWIGTQDAAGSMKAKAEAEEHGFHAHVEVPDPIPSGSKVWIEIEYGQGETAVASFDLKS